MRGRRRDRKAAGERNRRAGIRSPWLVSGLSRADQAPAEAYSWSSWPCSHLIPSMTTMLVMSETLPLSSVKAHLSKLVDRVEDQHDRVVVTRNGKPAAVLVSPHDLESLEETLAILSDPSLMAQIRESKQTDAKLDPAATLQELRAGLRSRNAAA